MIKINLSWYRGDSVLHRLQKRGSKSDKCWHFNTFILKGRKIDSKISPYTYFNY